MKIASDTPTVESANPPGNPGRPALCVIGQCDLRLWGHTPAERLERQFIQAGAGPALSPADVGRYDGAVVVVRADAVLDRPLVDSLLRSADLLLIGQGPHGPEPLAATVVGRDVDAACRLLAGEEPAALPLKLMPRRPHELGAEFWKGLRKRETPYAVVVGPDNRSAVEWRMFMGTYKGATDFVTKHLWPWPAFHVTRALAELRVKPNPVTLVGAVLTVAAFFLFIEGAFVAGLAAAWLMTFLDTVDGKLARTTLTSSKWGDIFDHGIDLVHPPFWYVAWGLGLTAAGQGLGALLWPVIAAILAGYVLQRAIEGIAIKWLGLEIHIWRPIDTWFRQVTARRNPNLAILTVATVLGRPDLGLLAVAIWTVLCLVLHGVQLVQAFAAKRRHGRLSSWMERPAAP